MFKNLNASLLGVSGHQSEIIELALTYGYGGLDLDIVDFSQRASKRGMPYARRLFDSAKLTLSSFQLPIAWDIDDDLFKQELQKLPAYAEVAAEVGCTRCLATIQPAGDVRPYHENFEFHRHRFTDIAKALEPFGVRVAIGFRAADDLRKGQAYQFIHEIDAVALLIKMIDAPNLGVLLDTWDMQVSGGSLEQVRALTAEKIVAVRVADLPEDAPADEVTEQCRSLPDPQGRVDVAGYLRVLAELGYDGPVTPAPARGTLQGIRRDKIVQKASRSLGDAWQAAGLTPDGKIAVTAES